MGARASSDAILFACTPGLHSRCLPQARRIPQLFAFALEPERVTRAVCAFSADCGQPCLPVP